MNRRASLLGLLCLVGSLVGVRLSAQTATTTFEWIGTQSFPAWNDGINWVGGIAPPNDGTALASFKSSNNRRVIFTNAVVVDALHFRSDGPSFIFEGSGTFPTLTINSTVFVESDSPSNNEGYYNYGTSRITFENTLSILLPNATTWTAPGGFEIYVGSPLSGAGRLTKEGSGQLVLKAENAETFSGGVTLSDGYLGIGSDNALGSGKLVLGPSTGGDPTLFTIGANRTVANDVEVSDLLKTSLDPQRRTINDTGLTFTGTVTLLGDSIFSAQGGPLTFAGDIEESVAGTSLTIANSTSPIRFTGLSNFTGGVNVLDGLAIFFGTEALPASPTLDTFTVGLYGYLGISQPNLDGAAFLARFERTKTTGTIGFDTNEQSPTPIIYAGAIDLTGFMPVARLGTATLAELSGTITPQLGSDYNFGGGGGVLTVSSTLANYGSQFRGVNVTSPASAPLLLKLTGAANLFSGPITVTNSGVIIANSGAVPANVPFVLSYGGYIGLAHTGTGTGTAGAFNPGTAAAFIAQFPVDLNAGIIGFDSADRSTPRNLPNLDLSRFTAAAPQFFIGSSTNVTLVGGLTPPPNSDAYRFAGYRGGTLTVQQVLADAGASAPRSVFIGDATNPLTHRAPDGLLSTVALTRANNHSGGTYLQMGRLVLQDSAALGSGTLFVGGGSLGYDEFGSTTALTVLEPHASVSSLANSIDLSSSLNVRNESPLTLSGVIDGYGQLLKSGAGLLTLAGDNTNFSGEVYVSSGSLTVATDNALGMGRLGFGTTSGLSANFTSAKPTVAGLYDSDALDATVFLGTSTTLTIDTQQSSRFSGTIAGSGRLEITGYGEQTLAGANTFSGGTVVRNGGTLVVSNSNALGNGPVVELNNGTLVLDNTTLSANLSFDELNGGKLSGNGSISLSTPLTLGVGAILSPGWSIGDLSLDGDVTLASGGRYDFEFADGPGGTLLTDSLYIYSVAISATSNSPFIVHVGSAAYDTLLNFDPATSRSWTLFTTGPTITGFDPAAFNVSLDSSFSNPLNGGNFSVGFDGLSTVSLNFTPVPEPSTFTLLLLGLALVGFSATRRRPRARA